MGPFQTKSLNGFQIAVTFVCDYSKYCVVKFMKNRSQVLDKIKEYVADTKKPQFLRSGNGTEYTSQAMKDFCVEKSIRQEFTVPETPQQNGVAERMNRTLVDMTRCLLIQSKLSKQYWVRAMATAVHIRNLIVTRDSPENKPPFELFWNKAPKLSHLRTFGSEAFVEERGHQRKLDAQSFRAKFIGYDDRSTAWLFVSLANGKIIRSRSAKIMRLKFQC